MRTEKAPFIIGAIVGTTANFFTELPIILPSTILFWPSLRSSASLRFSDQGRSFVTPPFQLTLTLPVTYGNSR